MKNGKLTDSQIGLCVDAIDFYIDNINDMLQAYGDAPSEEQINNIVKMRHLKNALEDKPIETFYVLTDSQDEQYFSIKTLEEAQNWLIDYYENHFSDEYTEEELAELSIKIKNTDADEICDFLHMNEYLLEKIEIGG